MKTIKIGRQEEMKLQSFEMESLKGGLSVGGNYGGFVGGGAWAVAEPVKCGCACLGTKPEYVNTPANTNHNKENGGTTTTSDTTTVVKATK